MSLIIKGMEMPKDHPVCVYIWPDGRVFPTGLYKASEWDRVKATPLPEGHGRMIDADELMNRARGCLDELTMLSLEFLVNGSSTIVPAEGGEH